MQRTAQPVVTKLSRFCNVSGPKRSVGHWRVAVLSHLSLTALPYSRLSCDIENL